MAAGTFEVVEHWEQLTDHDGFGPFANRILLAQCALAVVGEVGLHPLQIGGELGDLVGFTGRRRRRPLRGGTGR